MTRIVTSLRKNSREHVRVAWDEFEGTPYLDLRIFYEDGDALKPTKKGVTIRPALVRDLITALRSAESVGRELSLLPPEEA